MEVAWRKSVRSNAGQGCVEVARLPDAIGVRDSKDPNGPRLFVNLMAWQELLRRMRCGELDL
ncbi:hypothetical protein Acsp04_52790 [Actinomadura sp. NBRC 104425]|uniref:DUF397 domain-containing protein n=1 Tax=Actinomadura sp. NBRC 104425 TaxID=3032204 RepID=UPI0024A32BEF|nr:DUF397 domain-containing protein [Actinomadura sp. NBRC 104425]GLZ15044.1 hypothetical protein Acsp04_52790 [Actinomadura sp. NBRC 104425]